jgi:glyoxylase I family protein
MSAIISTKAIHHLTLTVTDVDRSVNFYTGLLNFQLAMELGERRILSNGNTLLVLGPPPDPTRARRDDSFDENRVGLDHLSFNVDSRADLVAAQKIFEQRGVPHGEIKDLGPDLGIFVMAFRDPDNVQLELTAPYGG